MALDRIGIGAALGAGVVGADVAALGAEAAGAIALLAREDSAARDVRKTLCIDAARGLRGAACKLWFRAERETHAVLSCDGRELGHERAFLLGLGIAPGEALPVRGLGEVAGALAV